MAQMVDEETLELGVSSAKAASLNGLAQVVATLISGATIILLARLLQPTAYGIYTLAYSVSIFFSAFGQSGMGHYLNKYVPFWRARKKRDELAKDIGVSYLTLAGICVAAIVLGFLFSGFLSQYVFHSQSYVSTIRVALITIVFVQLMYLSYNALIGFRDGIGAAVTYSAGTLAISVGSVGLVYLGFGVIGAFAGMAAGAAIGIAVGVFYITRHSRIVLLPEDIIERARKILRFSVPVAGAGIVVMLTNSFAILLLGSLSSPALMGSFGVAYRIGTAVLAATGFIGSVLLQMFSSARESRRSRNKVGKLFNYSVYFTAAMAVPLCTYLVVFAHPFVVSLFPAYESSLIYTPAITVSLLIGIIGAYASSLAISEGRVNKVFRYAVITGMIQLALLLALILPINAYAVILGVYLGGSLTGNYLYMRYMKRELGIKTDLGKPYKLVLASTIMGIIIYPVNFVPVSQTAQLAIGLVAMTIVYPVLLGLTKAMEREELSILRKIGESSAGFRIFLAPLVSYTSIFVR